MSTQSLAKRLFIVNGIEARPFGLEPLIKPEKERTNAVEALYRAHYSSLVRLLTLLVKDQGVAEELVQEAFCRLLKEWDRVRDPDRAQGYLRKAAINLSRSRFRRLRLSWALKPERMDSLPSAEGELIRRERDEAVIDAVRLLSRRQREAVVLRYYLELSEEEIASVLELSVGSVKTHLYRARRHLATVLGGES